MLSVFFSWQQKIIIFLQKTESRPSWFIFYQKARSSLHSCFDNLLFFFLTYIYKSVLFHLFWWHFTGWYQEQLKWPKFFDSDDMNCSSFAVPPDNIPFFVLISILSSKQLVQYVLVENTFTQKNWSFFLMSQLHFYWFRFLSFFSQLIIFLWLLCLCRLCCSKWKVKKTFLFPEGLRKCISMKKKLWFCFSFQKETVLFLDKRKTNWNIVSTLAKK